MPLCGNSIGTDRRFLAAYLPDIENYLHYRSVDVSTLKELMKRWNPALLDKAPRKAEGHRALDDIRESLKELRYYRDAFCVLPEARVGRGPRRLTLESPGWGMTTATATTTGNRAVRPRKQEQEPASEEITEVAPGILRLQLPTDFTGLGHVNTYAIEDSRGFTLVDPGLPSDESWEALQQRLVAAGIPLARVHTTYITHSHPDHFGGAHRLVEEAHAEVLTSTVFRRWTDLLDLDETPLEALDPADATEGGTLLDAVANADEEEMERDFPGFKAFRDRVRGAIADGRIEEASWMKAPRPTIVVDDAQTVRLGDRDWVAVFTPGPHPRPPLHVVPRGRRAPLRRPRAAHHHPPHRRVHRRRPPRQLPGQPRQGGRPRGHHPGPPGPRAPVRRPRRPVQRHQGPPRQSRLQMLADAGDELGWAGVTRWSEELFIERSRGPMADSETAAHLEHLRLTDRAERRPADRGLRVPGPDLSHGARPGRRARRTTYSVPPSSPPPPPPAPCCATGPSSRCSSARWRAPRPPSSRSPRSASRSTTSPAATSTSACSAWPSSCRRSCW